MRREAGEHENFFIAKNHDSESAQRAFEWLRRRAMTSGQPDRRMRELRKPLRYSRFLQYRDFSIAVFARRLLRRANGLP
jgi:hypothetical protein